jgi:LuxR family transcriptional regulator, maltose regulon positive regulatory protein
MSAASGAPGTRPESRTASGVVSILPSKITIPAVPAWCVQRERVVTAISAGARGPVTVLTGPPGSGKTTALMSWAASMTRPARIAWVSLDAFDNRPATFWSYVTGALSRSELLVPAELRAPVRKRPDQFLPELAMALTGQCSPTVLVLDDFHLLTDRTTLDGLSYLLRSITSDFHLLLSSRAEPSLPVQRYRLAGDLTEIRGEDLAFRIPEAEALMGRHGIALPPESLVTLTRRSAGWPVALRLVALAMAAHPDPGDCIAQMAAPDGAIARYFGEEVLSAQPARVRDLLCKTSILSQVSVELASTLARNGQARLALPALARANEFVQPAGDGWYRYHPLFAEVLRQQLQYESHGKVVQLHKSAARWLWRNGSFQEAVAHAAAAGDWPLAARMTVDELAVGTLLDPEAGRPLAAALRKLPVSAPPQQPPHLIVMSAMALRQGQDGACLTWLARAERRLGRLPADTEIPARLAVALIRMALASRRGDFDLATAAATNADRALGKLPADLLARHPEVSGQETCWRGAVQLWGGHFDNAAAAFAACPAHRNCGCRGRRILVEVIQGRFYTAEKLAFAPGLPSADGRAGGASPLDAAREIALAYVCLEHHRLSAAAHRVSMAERALALRPDKLLASLAQLAAACLDMVAGRAGSTLEAIARTRDGWSPPPWLEERLALVETHAHAAAGDIETALHAATREGPASTLRGTLALARVRLAAGLPGTAARLLATASTGIADETTDWIKVEALLLQAELWCGIGHPDDGRLALRQAVKQAEKERLVLPFASRRAWIEPVLRRDPDLAEAFQRLFRRAGCAANWPAVTPASAAATRPAAPDLLSARELEVLQYVSKLLSTDEIAREMQRSNHTVKSHLKSIFRKLGVSRRREAVHKAQQLGIL